MQGFLISRGPFELCERLMDVYAFRAYPSREGMGYEASRVSNSNLSAIDALPFKRKVTFKGTSSIVLLPLMHKWTN